MAVRNKTLRIALAIVYPRPRAASGTDVAVAFIVAALRSEAGTIALAIADHMDLAVFGALRLARTFARSRGIPTRPAIESLSVAVPTALRIVAFSLAHIIKGHVRLADAIFALMADRIAVTTIPGTVFMIAGVITGAITNEHVRARRTQIAVIAVLAVKATLEVEALLLADAVVYERVEAACGGIADVAVATVELTRADVALAVAVAVSHLRYALSAAVVAVTGVEGARHVETLRVTSVVSDFKRSASVGTVRAVLDLARAGVVALSIADAVSLAEDALWRAGAAVAGVKTARASEAPAKFIILNAKLLVFDTQFLVFNAKYLVLNI